jgi:hypothetical protein
MKKVIILLPLLMSALAHAQLSSTDIKDASTTGPFPIYVGLGFANSFRNQDLVDLGNAVYNYSNFDGNKKTRLYGIHAMIGVSIIPENSPLSLVCELRYIGLKRTVNANDNQFSLEKNQFNFGLGIRYAFFPVIVQAQAGPVIRHNRYYTFDVDGQRRSNQVRSWLDGVNVLARLTILDPAGTEGGPGFYIEAGYNISCFRKRNDELGAAIRTYDRDFNAAKDANNRYGYLAFGIVVPLAVRIP